MKYSAQRVVAAAVMGGTSSVLGGGRFANGAWTGAFSRVLNDEATHPGEGTRGGGALGKLGQAPGKLGQRIFGPVASLIGLDDVIQRNAYLNHYTTEAGRVGILRDEIIMRSSDGQGHEFCGKVEQHDYQLYLALNDIEHSKTKVKSPQTNGICERFHKTILNEFYQVTLRKKLYTRIEELQNDLDQWLIKYNTRRTHQGKNVLWENTDGKQIWQEKFVN